MFRRIFLIDIFLLFFVCCQLCEQGCAAQKVKAAVDADKIAEFLKDDKIKTALKSPDGASEDSQITVHYIQSAFLVAVNNVMVALAEVNYTEKDPGKKNKINVVAKHIDTNSENWNSQAIAETDTKWEVKIAGETFEKTNDKTVIKNLAVVVKDQTMYHLTLSNDTFKDEASAEPAKWHVRLIKGEVKVRSGKTIGWETLKVSVLDDAKKLEEQLKEQPKELLPSDGFVFVTNKHKNIMFIMKGKTKDSSSTSEKNITAIFQLDESGNKLKLLNVNNTEGCYPTFFQWKEKIYKTPTNDPKCSSGKVMEFNEDTNAFKDSEEPIASLLDFLKDKRNFTNADIETKKVLLFIQQKSATHKGDVNLWMYDGTRVGFVGAILKNILGTFYGSLLHTDKGLFALHAKYQTDSDGTKEDNTFSLTLLKEQLKNITDTLNAWEESDKTVSQLCENTRNTNIHCTTSPPIADLVGFLHNTVNEGSNEIIWKDEYYYSNVTIKNGNAENATNGLKFNGAGKGAQWLMKSKEKEQPYNFITSGFTLVATVTIGNDTNNVKNSILGVKLKSDTKTVGLWCNTDGKWGVSDGSETALKISENECKQGNTYNVALVLEARNLNIYLNGEGLTFSTGGINKFELSESIEQFYFGAKSRDAKSHVTVTNVLLYNRPFNQSEIPNLKNYIKSVEVVNTAPQNVDTNTAGGSSDEQTPPTLPTDSDEKKEDKKAPSPSRTEDGGVGGGVRVFSLLLALLCVSAPLLHL